MASPLPVSPKVRFAAFELDAAAGKLLKNGIPIKLQPQPLRVLLLLTGRPGQVVTRDEIQRCLWGDSTFVDFERGINFSINQIRAVLSDNAEKPRYIETLPRIGYRFIAPVTRDGLRNPAITAAPVSSGSVYEWPADSGTTVPPASEADTAATTNSATTVVQRKPKYVTALVVAALAVLGLVGFGVQRSSLRRRPDLENMQVTKLTDNGTAEDVAISPDGHYVVYALRDGEKEGLWLRQVATRSNVQILRPDTNRFHGLTFSPDGNYIYFVRSDKNDPFFKYLYSMPVLGGAARKLITDVDSPVSFSPNGHQFVYEHCIPPRNDLELKIASADGSDERLLTTLHNASCSLFQPGPNWSSDGRTIAVPVLLLSKPGRWALDAVSVAHGGVRELYSTADGIGRPVWLSSGDTLLVPRFDSASHRTQLWTISFPGGQARRFTNDLTGYGAGLDITRDGGTIAATARTMVSNIWVAPAADSLGGRQITFGELPMFDVVEDVDGKILSTSGDGELWTMNYDGSQRALFTEVHDTDSPTPCGRFVVFASYEAGSVVLTRVNVDGSGATRLVSGSLGIPTCSPDGKFALYVDMEGPQRIWRIPVEGGNPVQIAEVMGDGIAGRLTFSPDGRLLAYPYDQYSATGAPGWHLAMIPANGGPTVRTFELPGGTGGAYWSPDGKGLQYLLTRDGATNIWEQPLVGGEPKQLTKFTSGLIFDFNWSADHKRLLFTRGSVSSNVVLLSKFR